MKKMSVIAGLFALGSVMVSGQVLAACTGSTRLRADDIKAVIPGKYVCSKQGGADWKWQELHVGTAGVSVSGALIDYKKGPTDKVDPSKTVGNWAISGQGQGQGNNASIVYNYTAFGAAGPYTHSVHNNGDGTYSFCGSGPEVIATLQSGPGCR
jgi:hypothetical protein